MNREQISRRPASANLPPMFERDGKSVLTGLSMGQRLPRYAVLAVRDPQAYNEDIADTIARQLTGVEEISRKCMSTLLRGTFGGTDILICSTGSGAADAEVLIMDLMHYAGVDTFVRCGCTGTQQVGVEVGDIVITSGAVRDDGLTRDYVQPQYPAAANGEVLLALTEAAQRQGYAHHVGIIRSNDSIYCGQGRPACGYLQHPQDNIVNYWANAGVLGLDRETSTVLTLPQLFGGRGGSVCVVTNSSVTRDRGAAGDIDMAIRTVLQGIALLSKRDQQKRARDQEVWTPFCAEEAEK